MRSILKKRENIFFRYLKIYRFYILCVVIMFILSAILNYSISSIDAVFEEPNEVSLEDERVEENNAVYNYFLDFSPSMQGFFDETLDNNMKRVAAIFEDINADNEDNNFYWCRDTIERVAEAGDFYNSMKAQQILENYYESIVRNGIEDIGEEDLGNGGEDNGDINKVIDNIDLSNIFITNYADTVNSDSVELHVIITDMNFLKNGDDLEGHNEKISRFAEEIGKRAAGANICIYAIDSNYTGATNDAFSHTRSDNESVVFYVIVFSDNNNVYKEYCEQFESAIKSTQVLGKFELLNDINGEMPILRTDLDIFNSLGLVENKNLNFANGVFKNLDDNEFAVQLVTKETRQGTLSMPIAEVNLSGYYSANTLGLDNTKIDMEVELYQSKSRIFRKDSYELLENTSMVLYQNAGIYYDSFDTADSGHWFLRVNMELDTHPNIQESESMYKKLFLGSVKRRYLVMNLKFYMNEPSFSKPEWISALNYPNALDENMLNLETVLDKLIQYKQRGYISKPQEDRFLGNAVVYILY